MPFLFAFVVVIAAGLLSYVLDAWFLPTHGTLLILQLAVVVTALPGNKKSAIFSGIVSGVIFNYFFTTPRFSLHMSNVDDIVNLSIFLIVAVLTGILASSYRAQQEALEQAELRASILMSVSHDLRTPLATIIGSLSTMQEYQNKLPKEEKDELLNGALDDSHRLHRYIENLLQATKLHQGISLNSVQQDLLPIVNNVINRFDKARIRLIIRNALPNVTVSSYLLEQAIYNVVDNALKYSPNDTPVLIICEASDNVINLDIVDEGPGIASKHYKSVFDLFFSTRNGDTGEGGSGVGLTVTKGIIEAHHGTVSVMPSAKGCVIRISLDASPKSDF